MNASRKVLVVDDDPVVRKSFDRVLSGKGYAVITAENGEEALRKLNEEKYDLVYTDIRMPGMSGLEVAEQVKARKPWTPVVIITGYGTDAAETRAKAAGVSSFMHKPLSPEMIEGSARDALAAPQPGGSGGFAGGCRSAPGRISRPASTLKNIALVLRRALHRLGLHRRLSVCRPRRSRGHGGARRSQDRSGEHGGPALRHCRMSIAAPFIGLAFVVFFPFIGLAMLAWMGGRAVVEPVRTKS